MELKRLSDWLKSVLDMKWLSIPLTIDKIWWSLILPILFCLVLVGCGGLFAVGCQNFVLNTMIVLLGLFVGWIVGMVISPYDTQERGDFSTYTKAVSAFVSGYVVAKADALVSRVFSEQTFADSTNALRFLLAATSFVGAIAMTFTYRRYIADVPAAAKIQAEKVNQASGGRLSFGMSEERVMATLQEQPTSHKPDPNDLSLLVVEVSGLLSYFRYGMLERVENQSPTNPA
jgi:hypothetical protein